MYVLVVEDEEPTRKALIRLLESGGHRTCWAATGEAALKTMIVEKPDVVVLDMMLGPGMSGWDVAREKLLDPDLRAIPVIIVSGLAPATIHERATLTTSAIAGTMLILSKPVDFALLQSALQKLAPVPK
jgi:CheY-like chemotaxis protein